jgi:hypothetical protein
MEDNQEEIIKTYEESFVEEYDKWRGIIEDVN